MSSVATLPAERSIEGQQATASLRSRIPELDGIRAIAIALVISCHYQAFAGSFHGLPEFGWVGVEIFFVLSGYLITTNLLALRGTSGAYKKFYLRRVRRIFPPYFLTVAACALFFFAFRRLDVRTILLHAAFLPSFVHTGEILRQAAISLRHFNFPSLFQSAPLETVTPGVEPHSMTNALCAMWSLSVEEWFYILWAPIVLLFGRAGIIFATIPAFLIGFVLRWLNHAQGRFWYTEFFCRFDLLAMGALLALWLYFRKDSSQLDAKRGDRILWGLGLASFLALVFLVNSIRPVMGREIRDSALFAAFGTVLIGITVASGIAFLVLSGSEPRLLSRVLGSRVAVWVGRRSYMIYLAHIPWYWVVCAILGSASYSGWTAAITALVLTLVTAALSWKYVEAPLLSR
ncbi:acyltransferase [Alloacidobacterium dinghuense]|uniref:Acyltransferase n=1 Tax=Alloacidobacterium dinghuense TaxID=2763107 RepID=A0A7G8BQ41_9BACT|nr:acyltransferase [Alloacidobacterium dinghuense]QNI34661.1 acyltransferase [Alloacidobacterium dinghuense]